MFLEWAWKVSDDYMAIFKNGSEVISSTSTSMGSLVGTLNSLDIGNDTTNTADFHIDHIIISNDSTRNLYELHNNR